jgi:hypothetical protein
MAPFPKLSLTIEFVGEVVVSQPFQLGFGCFQVNAFIML